MCFVSWRLIINAAFAWTWTSRSGCTNRVITIVVPTRSSAPVTIPKKLPACSDAYPTPTDFLSALNGAASLIVIWETTGTARAKPASYTIELPFRTSWRFVTASAFQFFWHSSPVRRASRAKDRHQRHWEKPHRPGKRKPAHAARASKRRF